MPLRKKSPLTTPSLPGYSATRLRIDEWLFSISLLKDASHGGAKKVLIHVVVDTASHDGLSKVVL